jgi:hypothetical protein
MRGEKIFSIFWLLSVEGGFAEPIDPAIEVHRFWKEVKQRHRHIEFISDRSQKV